MQIACYNANFNLVNLGLDPRFSICNKLPGDADAVSPRTAFV